MLAKLEVLMALSGDALEVLVLTHPLADGSLKVKVKMRAGELSSNASAFIVSEGEMPLVLPSLKDLAAAQILDQLQQSVE